MRVIKFSDDFNFSAINNFAASKAIGEILVLLNNDIEVIKPDWLTELVSHANRPGIGAVGCRLYYPDDHVQLDGLIIGMGGVACVIGGSLSMDEPTWPEYNENIHIIHNQGTDDERRYERIPVTMEGDIIHYQLKEIHKQGSRGGGLIALGIAIIVGDFIYDRLKGFQLIEEKRNKVRYKYGQLIKFTYKPNFYYSEGQSELGMKLNFDLF